MSDVDPWDVEPPRRRPVLRLLAVLVLVALVAGVVGLLLGGRGGTVVPEGASSTTPPSPPPTVAAVANQPCEPVGARRGEVACQPTPLGPLWSPVPFAGPRDVVGVLGTWPDGTVPASDFLTLDHVSVAVGNRIERAGDEGAPLWCVSLALVNGRAVPLAYGPEHLRLLDPRGDLTPAAAPTVLDPPPLTAGELLPTGTTTGYACFAASGQPGRHAVVYQPPGSVDRALAYFDV